MQAIEFTPRQLSYRQRLTLAVHAFQPKHSAKVWGNGVEPWLTSLNRMEDAAIKNHPQFTASILHQSDSVRYAVRRGDMTKREALISFRSYVYKLGH